MDGDGDMDIVSASMSDNTIAWYENNGAADPSWTASDISTRAYGAHSVFAADMDGDGDMDIISAGINDIIAWYENNGAADPTWIAAADGEWIATSADEAKSVFAADMDGDGDLDIVSASSNDDTIAWYENNGAADPTWTAADIATSADEATSVFVADMDGDGDMDIISASYADDTIAWYENGIGYSYSWDVDSGGAPSDATYRATVAGADLAGNAYSGTESITFTLDTTAPTVTLTDTDSDNLVSISQVVTITAGFSEAMTATPTISITGIVTNVIMTPVSGTNSYTFTWDTSSGPFLMELILPTVSGTDLIGNAYVSGTQSITFTVDTSAPTVAITSSDSDNTVKSADSNITVTATFNEAMATAPTITIGSSIDNVALTATSSTTWTYDWDISSVTEGSYTVTVTGTDPAGNTYAGNDSITLTVDNTAPTTTLSDTDADNILAVSDSVTITAFFNEGMTATPTISITGVVTNVTMSPQNGLALEANSNFWNTGEPNNSGGEDVLELDSSKVNDIPSSISQKSIIEFSDNRNSTISNFTYVGSYQGHSYYKSTNSSNWTTAKDNAITLGGNLVVINIQAELDYLNSVILSNTDNYHIGAYQDTGAAEPDGGWIWVSNKNNSYQYTFTVSNSLSSGTYYATVAGIDKASNAYSGTESITFTLDATLPTVTLTDNAADNIISTTLSPTNTVTITASFSEAMTATPSIYITGVVTNVAMTRVGSTNNYTYNWNTSTPTLAAGAYSVTVSGTDRHW